MRAKHCSHCNFCGLFGIGSLLLGHVRGCHCSCCHLFGGRSTCRFRSLQGCLRDFCHVCGWIHCGVTRSCSCVAGLLSWAPRKTMSNLSCNGCWLLIFTDTDASRWLIVLLLKNSMTINDDRWLNVAWHNTDLATPCAKDLKGSSRRQGSDLSLWQSVRPQLLHLHWPSLDLHHWLWPLLPLLPLLRPTLVETGKHLLPSQHWARPLLPW